MLRHPVASTNVLSVGYDRQSQTLEVEFQAGSVYQYYGVPEHMYEQFMRASSKGQYLNTYIRDQYPYSRVG